MDAQQNGTSVEDREWGIGNILECIFDLSFDCTDTLPTSSSPDTAFETRGVSLEFLLLMAKASTSWPLQPRVCLENGDTGIVLVQLSERPCGVQVRTLSEGGNIQRAYHTVSADETLVSVVAAVGDRVYIEDAQYAEHANICLNTWSGKWETDADTPNVVLGAVVGFDPGTRTYDIELPVDVKSTRVANFALSWQVSAAKKTILRAVPSDKLQLDFSFTTKDACEELVKPLTRRTMAALVEILATHYPGHVGVADAFASHAWLYNFSECIEALSNWHEASKRFPKSDGSTCFIWFDICTVCQHPSRQRALPEDYFYNQFQEGIASIGSTVLVMIPALRPIPVKRSWCVWEIYCTLKHNALLETAITTEDARLMASKSIVSRVEVDVEKAEAFMEADRANILSACQAAPGGCQSMNKSVAEAFSLDQIESIIRLHQEKNDGPYRGFTFGGLTIGPLSCRTLQSYCESQGRSAVEFVNLFNANLDPSCAKTFGQIVGDLITDMHQLFVGLHGRLRSEEETYQFRIGYDEMLVGLAPALKLGSTLKTIRIDLLGPTGFHALCHACLLQQHCQISKLTLGRHALWEEQEYLFRDEESLRLLAEVLKSNASIITLETSFAELKNQESLTLLVEAINANEHGILVSYGQQVVPDLLFQRALLRPQLRCVQQVENNWDLFSHQHSHFNKPMDSPFQIYTTLSKTYEHLGDIGSAIDAMNRCTRLTPGLSENTGFTERLDTLWEMYEKGDVGGSKTEVKKKKKEGRRQCRKK
jgi:hypothetical protein